MYGWWGIQDEEVTTNKLTKDRKMKLIKLFLFILLAIGLTGCSGLIALLGANPARYTAPYPNPHPCYYPCEEDADGYRVYRVKKESNEDFNARMYREDAQWR